MIRKVMSFFWSGGKVSWMRYMCLYSFRKLNPDWEIRLYGVTGTRGLRAWTSGEGLDAEDYKGINYSEKLDALNVKASLWIPPIANLSPTHAADLFRWDYLQSESGWYSDTDVLWVRPMPDIDADFVGCETYGIIGVGLLAGKPNDLWKGLYESALSGYDPKGYQSTGTEAIYRYARLPAMSGWELIAQSLKQLHPTVEIEILPHEVYCPWNATQVYNIFSKTETVPEACVGIHWFGGSPIGQEWNNRLTEGNYRSYLNTYTKYARQLL